MLLIHLKFMLFVFTNIEIGYGIIDGFILNENPALESKMSFIVRIARQQDLGSMFSESRNYISTGICVDEWWVLSSFYVIYLALVDKKLYEVEICLDHMITNSYGCATPSLIRSIETAVRNPEMAKEHSRELQQEFFMLRLNQKYDRQVMTPARLFKAHITDYIVDRKLFKNCVYLGWGAENYSNFHGIEYFQYATALKYGTIDKLKRCKHADEQNSFCLQHMDTALCSGDYGAPIVCDDYVIAVCNGLNFQKYCDKHRQYATFEEIFLYIEWIQQTILEASHENKKPVTVGRSTRVTNNMAYINTFFVILVLFNISIT